MTVKCEATVYRQIRGIQYINRNTLLVSQVNVFFLDGPRDLDSAPGGCYQGEGIPGTEEEARNHCLDGI